MRARDRRHLLYYTVSPVYGRRVSIRDPRVTERRAQSRCCAGLQKGARLVVSNSGIVN